MKRSENPSLKATNKLDGFGRGFSSFCTVAALVLFLAVMLYLSTLSLVETSDMNMNNSTRENIDYLRDNFFSGAILTVLLLAIFFACRHLIERLSLRTTVIICLASVFVFGVLWTFSSLSAPTFDSYYVSNAAYKASIGDYSALDTDYFRRYPFQLGYVLFSEIFVRLFHTGDNYLCIEVINVVCLVVTYLSLIMLSRRIYKNDSVIKMLAILFVFCLQPILFCTFTYGNIPGLMFASLAMWQMFEIKGKKYDWLHAVLCALFIGFSVSIKKNFMIAFAAILIIGAVRLVKRRKLCELVCLLLCVVSVWGVSGAVKLHYEQRSGLEFGDGIPMISWMAMGLNESYSAPGWYNSKYTIGNYNDHGGDPDAAADASVEAIKARLEELSADKQYAVNFFGDKIASQWNEPTYQSIWTNQVRGRYGNSMGIWASWVCGEGEQTVKSYMNIFQQLVFVLTAVAAALLIKKREIGCAMLPTVILGGFIYHALFEAKSQYAVVYFVLMLPVAAYGANALFELFSGYAKKHSEKLLGGRRSVSKKGRSVKKGT